MATKKQTSKQSLNDNGGSKTEKLKALKSKTVKEKPEKKKKAEKPKKKIDTKGKTTDQIKDELENTKPEKKPGTVTYKKIKIERKKDFVEITLSIIEPDMTLTNDVRSMRRPAHPDFKAALASLRVHWGILNDYISPNAVKDIQKYDPAIVKDISVSGIIVGGNDGEEGIQITGSKYSRRKKSINNNTPFERFEEVELTRYKNMDDVLRLLDILNSEAELYLSGEKYGEEAQGKFNFEKGSENDQEDEKVQTVDDAAKSNYADETA